MKVELLTPSMHDVKCLDQTGMLVQPLIFCKTQRFLRTFPFEVKTDSGQLLDKGFLIINTKTGKASIEHRLETLVSEADQS